MARSHARIHVSAYDPEAGFTDLDLAHQGLYLMLVARRDINFCGVLPYKPKVWAGRAANLTPDAIRTMLAELERLEYVVIDEVTEELWVRTFIHHDQVLAMPQVAMTMARQYDTVESATIRARIREALPPGMRDGFPGNLSGHRKQVAELLDEHDAKAFKPDRTRPPDGPGNPPDMGTRMGSDMGTDNPSATLPNKGSGNPSTMGTHKGLGTVDGGRWSGEHCSSENPQPHAERGEPQHPQPAPDHHGQHPNCRRCGTNPRALGTNQRGPRPPDPSELAVQAAAAQMERNAARTRGDSCGTCDGAYWLDPELQDDRTWGPARPCPDCNPEARTA